MKNTGMCPKCSSRDVLRLTDIIDQVGTASFGLAQEALVCGACGFVEFYAQDLEAVRTRAESRNAAGTPFR